MHNKQLINVNFTVSFNVCRLYVITEICTHVQNLMIHINIIMTRVYNFENNFVIHIISNAEIFSSCITKKYCYADNESGKVRIKYFV